MLFFFIFRMFMSFHLMAGSFSIPFNPEKVPLRLSFLESYEKTFSAAVKSRRRVLISVSLAATRSSYRISSAVKPANSLS